MTYIVFEWPEKSWHTLKQNNQPANQTGSFQNCNLQSIYAEIMYKQDLALNKL